MSIYKFCFIPWTFTEFIRQKIMSDKDSLLLLLISDSHIAIYTALLPYFEVKEQTCNQIFTCLFQGLQGPQGPVGFSGPKGPPVSTCLSILFYMLTNKTFTIYLISFCVLGTTWEGWAARSPWPAGRDCKCLRSLTLIDYPNSLSD